MSWIEYSQNIAQLLTLLTVLDIVISLSTRLLTTRKQQQLLSLLFAPSTNEWVYFVEIQMCESTFLILLDQFCYLTNKLTEYIFSITI